VAAPSVAVSPPVVAFPDEPPALVPADVLHPKIKQNPQANPKRNTRNVFMGLIYQAASCTSKAPAVT